MKDRIAHIMRAKNLKASDFAELLGIQPSGISHILSGRNQPSLDFVKKIKENFPEYNLDWIIFGKGPMTTSEPFRENSSPVVQESTPSVEIPLPSEPLIPSGSDTVSPSPSFIPVADPVTPPRTLPAGIKSVMILFDDGTFETYSPR